MEGKTSIRGVQQQTRRGRGTNQTSKISHIHFQRTLQILKICTEGRTLVSNLEGGEKKKTAPQPTLKSEEKRNFEMGRAQRTQQENSNRIESSIAEWKQLTNSNRLNSRKLEGFVEGKVGANSTKLCRANPHCVRRLLTAVIGQLVSRVYLHLNLCTFEFTFRFGD